MSYATTTETMNAIRGLFERHLPMIEEQERIRKEEQKKLADWYALHPEKAASQTFIRKSWTEDDISQLMNLRRKETPFKDIAEAMDRSAEACKGQWHNQLKKGKTA